MKKLVVLIILYSSFFGIAYNPPCPTTPRRIPNNGIYGEIGGGGIYTSFGYNLNINNGYRYFRHRYHALNIGMVFSPEFMNRDQPKGLTAGYEFNGELSSKSMFYWLVGASYTRLFNSSSWNPEVLKNSSKENYLSPMVGIEFMFFNHIALDIKYQPYFQWSENSTDYNFKSYGGVALKILIGTGYYQGGGGF